MPDRRDQAIVKTAAVFVKRVSRNETQYIRRPYNIVTRDYRDGNPPKSYIEPIGTRPRSPSESAEVYDEIKVYDTPPDFDTIGRG